MPHRRSSHYCGLSNLLLLTIKWPRLRRTPQQTLNAFQWAEQSLILPISVRGSRSHLIHGSWGPPVSASLPQGHLDRFSRFCRAHERDQHTHRPRYSVWSNRPHLMHWEVHATRPNNILTYLGPHPQPVWFNACADSCLEFYTRPGPYTILADNSIYLDRKTHKSCKVNRQIGVRYFKCVEKFAPYSQVLWFWRMRKQLRSL